MLEGVSDVFGRVASGQAFNSPLDFISTAITAVNTYQNSKNLTKAGVSQEFTNIAVKGITNVGRAGAGSVNNTVFPVNDSGNANITIAKPRSINGGG